MSFLLITRRKESFHYPEENEFPFLLLTHYLNHSGYIRDGQPEVTPSQEDGVEFDIICRVTKEGGLPGVSIQVSHDAYLEEFVHEGDEEKDYYFNILIKEGDEILDWTAETNQPIDERNKAKVRHIKHDDRPGTLI
jgi:hypothetical protein